MSLAPNTQLGPYLVSELLGVGGMGEVYRARDSRLDRDVALKVLSHKKIKSPDHKQRFVLEARAASGLNHPNIITIYDIGSVGEIDFIAMEYVAGKTLDATIPPNGLRLPQVLKIAIDVAEGLAAAHRAGIVHRDLKPANIMVTDDGRVKLLDFGLAKLVESTGVTEINDPEGATSSAPLTVEGAILGTVSYMSPEQAEGLRVDARSDVFSFGAVLYEMVTGKRAFTSTSTISTLSAILKDEPERASSIVAGVPEELERVISRCLRKDPDRRWQSMKEVVIRLTELKEVSDSGTLLRSSVTAASTRPAVSSKRPLLGGIVAGVVIATLFVAWWISRLPASEGSTAAVVATDRSAPSNGTVLSKPTPEILTNDQVIEMVKARVSTEAIIEHIQRTKSRFDLSTTEVIRLSQAGVPDAAISAMRGRARSTATSGGPAIKDNPSANDQARNKEAETPAARASLAAGTMLALTLDDELSTANAKERQRVRLSVAKNVLLGSTVVIPAGSKVTATVVSVGKKTMFRRTPKLKLQLDALELADGRSVALRATAAADADSRRGKEIDAASLLGAAPDSSKGQELTLPKGQPITAYLAEAVEVGAKR
ncbi:MAG: protein kinase [Acidobacteriota bacterium]